MSEVAFVIGFFLLGVIFGVRWAYHDIEVAEKKWKALYAPKSNVGDDNGAN